MYKQRWRNNRTKILGMGTHETDAAFRNKQCRKKEIKALLTEHELIA